MNPSYTEIQSSIRSYFSESFGKYGAVPLGVGWAGEYTQTLRFAKLAGILRDKGRFTINEIGCGYGRFYRWLKENGYENFHYTGCDLVPEMIDFCRQTYIHESEAQFFTLENDEPLKAADYIVASGVFNIRLQYSRQEWTEFIQYMLKKMFAAAGTGIAFNLLTAHAINTPDAETIYYADPAQIFDFCARNLSTKLTLLHNYVLSDFTVFAWKSRKN